MATPNMIRIERTYPTSAEEVWRLWTTSEGIESWWAPDGFKCDVRKLDLRPGGELVYALTATGPEQAEFMKGAGVSVKARADKPLTQMPRPTSIGVPVVIVFVL